MKRRRTETASLALAATLAAGAVALSVRAAPADTNTLVQSTPTGRVSCDTTHTVSCQSWLFARLA